MILAEPIAITQQISLELERLGIKYLVGGSLASSLHGVPRATQDVDMVADIQQQHIPFFVKALEADFYVDAGMIREAIQRQSSFNVIHLATMFKADIFILKSDKFSREEMARREPYQVTDRAEEKLFIASAEDVIVHKLYWYKLGGKVSERQWNDALGVLQVRKDRLDITYLFHAAQLRGVVALLKKALSGIKIDE